MDTLYEVENINTFAALKRRCENYLSKTRLKNKKRGHVKVGMGTQNNIVY